MSTEQATDATTGEKRKQDEVVEAQDVDAKKWVAGMRVQRDGV